MLRRIDARSSTRILLLLAAAAFVLGCRGKPASLRAEANPQTVSMCTGACTDSVQVRFLGVDGFVFRHGTSSVLTAPLFSRKPVLPTFFAFRFVSDTATMTKALAAYHEDLRDVQMVLVGHSHYDHLMDVPAI